MSGQSPHSGNAQNVPHAGLRPWQIGGCKNLSDPRHLVRLEDLLSDGVAGV